MARIATVLADGYEDSEFSLPQQRLTEAGHDIVIIGSETGKTVSGKRGEHSATIDKKADGVYPGEFDALLIPGGHAPDSLRTDDDVVAFVRGFVDTGKPVAAICHGPQLLIEADAVDGRTLTSFASVRKDLENAGAKWIDRAVVEDGNLITSRTPDDLDAFVDALLDRLQVSA